MNKITLLVLTFLMSTFSYAQISISEIDADQTSTDNGEFIELYTPSPNTSLDGYVVVLYNGNGDQSYEAYDLDGYSTDANGFLLLANDGFPGMDISLGSDNGLQNGEDAVAIYQDDASNFPNGTSVTSTNLVAALVYGTGDPDDTGLFTGLGETVQYNEDINGLKDIESIQNDGSGTFCIGVPTPDATNINCGAVCPLDVNISQVVCDVTTTGTDTYTVTLNFTGGGTETYAITASAGTIGGDDPSSMPSGTITISGINEGTNITYSVTSTLCNLSGNVTSPTCEPATQVSSIADLRNGTLGERYMLTQEVLLTYQQDYNNQKYIEDATAAILMEDISGNITTTYAIGDGITGITGELSGYNDILLFIPESDPGAPTSTGNMLTPQTLTLTQLTNNPADYDAELVKVLAATVTTTDNNITNWIIETVFPMATTDGNFNFRTSFHDADYIGTPLPSDLLDITGIITRYDTDDDDIAEYFLTARSSADMVENLGMEENNLVKLKLYPNPSNGILHIRTASNEAIVLEIYSMLGEKILTQEVDGSSVDLTTLQAGIYLARFVQEGDTITRKLIIN